VIFCFNSAKSLAKMLTPHLLYCNYRNIFLDFRQPFCALYSNAVVQRSIRRVWDPPLHINFCAAEDAEAGRPGVVQTSFSCSFGAIHLLRPLRWCGGRPAHAAMKAWPRPASLVPAGQFTFSLTTAWFVVRYNAARRGRDADPSIGRL
jgi:hypothetical protein